MAYQFSAKLRNGFSTSLRVVIEPWATEHWLSPEESCEVRALSENAQPYIEMEVSEYGAIFWVEGQGSIYEYWQSGVLIE
ncbi:MAG TPA: hypothetical protein VGC12_00795 [Methyloradius sp.]